MFRGILVPTLTPVAPDGGVDLDALRSHADWLIERGVHGLYPCGSTGEGVRLTADERREVVKATCETAAGRVPVLAGVCGANLSELLAECDHAAECGAAAVAVTAPVYFRPSAEAIFTHFEAVADCSPVGVLVYNIPAFAVPIPVETTVRLAAECPNVVGVKDSSGDASQMVRLCGGHPAGPAGLFDPDRLGRGVIADARRRGPRRHERHGECRPGACAGGVRPVHRRQMG